MTQTKTRECDGSKMWTPSEDTNRDPRRSMVCPYCGRTVGTSVNSNGTGRRLDYHHAS